MTRAARELRRRSTRSEGRLWEVVRGRRFHGLRFRRQETFGPFVLDFYCSALRLAIEVDGGVHDAPERARRDLDRAQVLEEHGVRVIRVAAAEVESDARRALEAALAAASVVVPRSARD